LLQNGAGFVVGATADTAIPAVNENVNGCAPGSAARSIKYLGLDGARSAQDVYNVLYGTMGTTLAFGTTRGNFQTGKNNYTDANGNPLPVTTTQVFNSPAAFQQAIDALNRGADVEIMINWGPGLGGHAAFVKKIIAIKTPGGAITGYVITYIDDANQADGQPGSNLHQITVNGAGMILNGQARVRSTANVIGFQIEELTPPSPPPSPSFLDGLFGFVNVFTQAATGLVQWAVQNAPIFIPIGTSLGGYTETYTFDLDVTPGTDVSTINFYKQITATPMLFPSVPATWFSTSVGDVSMLFGGLDGGGTGSLTILEHPENFNGLGVDGVGIAQVVPEPATFVLAAAGAAALALRRRIEA
jgi:hypothetical protein